MAHPFSKEELQRCSRQLMLPEIGIKGQAEIKAAKVLVIGAGGLGCPVLLYLTGAGVGTIGIVDFDKVEIHNLHRQILYDTADIGKQKTFVATEKIRNKNPFVQVVAYNEMLTGSNAEAIIGEYDIVVDGSDNFITRYLINDVCVKLSKPLVYGSILKHEGQMAVFNLDGSKSLRDLFPEPPNAGDVPGCDENGVMGFVPGILGVYMANITIQVIIKQFSLKNELIFFDFQELKLNAFKY